MLLLMPVGLWIPALNIFLHNNYRSLIALIFRFIGAYVGAMAGRLLRRADGAV